MDPERGAGDEVRLLHGTRVLARDWLKDKPAGSAGSFNLDAGLIGLPSDFEVTVAAALSGGAGQPVARIRGRRDSLRTSFGPTIQPLLVTSMARTGTTWLMRLLFEMPSVVVEGGHPYETRAARYWMHALTVLGEPARMPLGRASGFMADPHRVGGYPRFGGGRPEDARRANWFDRSYLEHLASFFQRTIEAFYTAVAQGRPVRYFAEKSLPDHISRVTWELYPETREVFLVRDPRDMVSSMLAFNEKRGYPSFGRERDIDDAGWLQGLRAGLDRLLASVTERSAPTLLLRYEDLIRDPLTSMASVGEYLGIDAGERDLRRAVARASVETPESRAHRTASAELSVGQWRERLDPRFKDAVEEAFNDVLPRLGYE